MVSFRSMILGVQVRCRAEGVTLRSSVTKNGTRTCRHDSEKSERLAYSYGSFWLYLLFRSVGEMCVIGSVILLYAVTLNYDNRRCSDVVVALQPRALYMWWIWGLVGQVALAPLAGYVNDVVGFGVGFLLGSLSLGLASLMIAISPTPTMPVTPAPTPSFASVSQEEENQSKLLNTQQVPRPQRQCLSLKGALQVINYPASVAVLVTMLFFGLASGVVPTALHWYVHPFSITSPDINRWLLTQIGRQAIHQPLPCNQPCSQHSTLLEIMLNINCSAADGLHVSIHDQHD